MCDKKVVIINFDLSKVIETRQQKVIQTGLGDFKANIKVLYVKFAKLQNEIYSSK